ncbi:hypothetical protein B5M09_013295, partial [Aphanomyces astaci]
MGAAESTSRVFSQEIPFSDAPGYGPIRTAPGNLPLADHTTTLWENFKVGLSVGADNQYLGTRSRNASGKAGPYTWLTYNEAHDRATRIATGFHHLLKVGRQEVVGLFSKNRAEWILTEIACNRMSYVVVPLYDTLGPKAIPFILNHTNMRVLVCSGDLVATVLQAKGDCPSLEFASVHIVLCIDMRLLHLVPPSPPLPSDVSTICYTSGTTGDPKGAILTHRNYTTATLMLADRIDCRGHMVHISYLPLPHVMERCVTSIIARLGASMGFYQGDVVHLMDDMAELKPHLYIPLHISPYAICCGQHGGRFVSVPRLFNRVYDKIVQGVASAGGVKKLMFDYAYATKKQGLADGTNVHALWDALVFSK